MKIMFIITGLNQGGAESMLYKLLLNINRSMFDCSVVSILDLGFYGEKIQSLGIPVFCLNLKKKPCFFKYIKFLIRYQPDIIQGWMYHANLLSIFSKLFSFKSKIIFNIRHSLEKEFNEKKTTSIIIKLNAIFSRFVFKVINNSKKSIRQHREIGFYKKNECYIPNGFDMDLFKPNPILYSEFRKKYDLSDETKIVGCVARYHAIKNHVGVLNTFKKIREEFKEKVMLVLAGPGVDINNDFLIKEIARLGLTRDCLLLGSINAAAIMPALDLHLLCSFSEGFPNVIGEAMACGLPCVATDVGDCKEIINSYGSVLPLGKDELMAKECIHHLNFPQEKNKIRQHIMDHFSIKKIVQDYENLYKSI